ncbi:MAG: hypothetical protein EYC70_02150 [Planctomycetota bacterium]|nr:MAG: hypothetical protein EYC70_02150 [Planctomycetota bacterium]
MMPVVSLVLWLAAQAPLELGIGAAEPLPEGWEKALAGPDCRELALRLAHTGLPRDADEAALGRALERQEDPGVMALLAAAVLAPARLTGRAPLAEEARAQHAAAVVQFLLQVEDDPDLDVLVERVAPRLRAGELDAVAELLLSGACRSPHRAVSLLQVAPYSEARPFLLRVALAESGLDPQLRAACAEHVFAVDGRGAGDALAPLLRPDAPDVILRRLLSTWEAFLEPADLPALERVASEAPGPSAAAALLLWARHESDPARRLRIFELGMTLPGEEREHVLDALARAGPDPQLAARLLELLDDPRVRVRQLALRFLPRLAPAELLFREYRSRAAVGAGEEDSGAWMVELARLPVAEAQRAAAQWLADGGWHSGSTAVGVARALRDSAQVDAFLDGLLRLEDGPEDVLLPLAMGRAAHAESARAFLRQALERGPSPRRGEAIRVLAEVGQPRDLRLLLDLARDPNYAAPARAAAIRGLAGNRHGAPLLGELLQPPPADYEVAETLIRALVSGADPALRAAALQAARGRWTREQEEEAVGLRLAAWQEQAEHPLAGEAAELEAELWMMLTATLDRPGPAASEPLDDPLVLARKHAEVHDCAQALAAAIAARGGEPPRAPALLAACGQSVPPGPLWIAALKLTRSWPELSGRWCGALAARPGVSASTRVRALATWARPAFSAVAPEAEPALEALLARPSELVRHPWDLAYGVGRPGARAWVLPVERLADQRLLHAAAAAAGAQRLELLAAFADGAGMAGVLVEAAELALEAGEGAALALRLAGAGADLAPLEVAARYVLAQARRGCGDMAGARREYQAAVRLSVDGEALREAARAALAEIEQH